MFHIGICDDEKGTCAQLEEWCYDYGKKNGLDIEIYVWYTGESLCDDISKKRENFFYFLFYFVTVGIYLAFHFPLANIAANILMLYVITQLYEGEQKKKILVTFLIYGINMICDMLSVYSFSNYKIGEKHIAIVAYITVLLISICEFIIERFL